MAQHHSTKFHLRYTWFSDQNDFDIKDIFVLLQNYSKWKAVVQKIIVAKSKLDKEIQAYIQLKEKTWIGKGTKLCFESLTPQFTPNCRCDALITAFIAQKKLVSEEVIYFESETPKPKTTRMSILENIEEVWKARRYKRKLPEWNFKKEGQIPVILELPELDVQQKEKEYSLNFFPLQIGCEEEMSLPSNEDDESGQEEEDYDEIAAVKDIKIKKVHKEKVANNKVDWIAELKQHSRLHDHMQICTTLSFESRVYFETLKMQTRPKDRGTTLLEILKSKQTFYL